MDVGRFDGHRQYDAASGITLKPSAFPLDICDVQLASRLGWERRMILRERKSNICQFLIQSGIGSPDTRPPHGEQTD
ncbi:hypothetical protein Rcae01_02637 [Novipirellula caenicola]|uniref:Uncharacterized protein n=1 Tax=Novipirellula caenicola TaxID=1536901 RepID=A0ABP9VPV9_9BACT